MSEMVDRDLEHLRLLQFAYYILAGLTGFGTLCATLWMVMAGAMLAAIPVNAASADPATKRILGFVFLAIGILIVAGGVGATLLTFFTARNLGQRRSRIFCIVVAALTCLSVPWGTAIGVCCIIVLNRPGVKALFDGVPPALPVQAF
jgi:hypothetical protein